MLDRAMRRTASAERFRHIDCLRAVAVLSVAGAHYLDDAARIAGGAPAWFRTLTVLAVDVFDFGRLGVMLFFIVSGYCIANSILRPGARPVASFAINRAFRIYPAYWLSLAAATAIYGPTAAGDVAANVLLVQKFVGRADIMGVYWTLAVELSFYALCIALFVLGLMGDLRRLQAVGLALFGYCVLAALARAGLGIALPFAWPYFLSLMIGGAVLRRIDDSGIRAGRLIALGALGALAGTLVIAVCVYADPAAYQKSWYRDFLSNGLAIAIFLALNYLYRPRSAAFAYIGRISYSIYLFHTLVGAMLLRFAGEAARSVGTLGPAAVIALELAIAVGISSLTYLAIERPGIRAGHRLARALSASRSPVRAADPAP